MFGRKTKLSLVEFEIRIKHIDKEGNETYRDFTRDQERRLRAYLEGGDLEYRASLKCNFFGSRGLLLCLEATPSIFDVVDHRGHRWSKIMGILREFSVQLSAVDDFERLPDTKKKGEDYVGDSVVIYDFLRLRNFSRSRDC